MHRELDWSISNRLSIWTGLVIGIVVFISFQPILKVDFFAEDHVVLDEVIRMKPAQYFAYSFQQCLVPGFCRPAEDWGIWLEYALLGSNAQAFRLIQVLIHVINCLLLYHLTRTVSRKNTIGLYATLVYAGLPVTSTTFPWLGSADPSVTFFYLLAIVVWLNYLNRKRWWLYMLALFAAVLGLLNKEVGITIPIALVLADWWLVRNPIKWRTLVRRYALLVIIWGFYGWFMLQRLTAFTSTSYSGNYGGVTFQQIIPNLVAYFAMLASLWQTDTPLGLILLILGIPAIVYWIGIKRNLQVAFVLSVALLSLSPVLLFAFVAVRYLYMPIMASAILFAVIVNFFQQKLDRFRGAPVLGAAMLGIIVWMNGMTLAQDFESLAGFVREYRSPVRPVFQKYTTLAQGVQLYFVDSPISPRILTGMMAVRYGKDVTVSTTDQSGPANLRDNPNVHLFLFDDQRLAVEQTIAPNVKLQSVPAAPVDFANAIRFEGCEVASTTVKHGESIFALLYWRAMGPIDKDYTIFAHLIDGAGKMVAGADGFPRNGKLPTSTWHANQFVVDWINLPIIDDVPVGSNYRLEFGWYYAPTLERITAVNGNGSHLDHIFIESFTVQ